MPSSAHGVLGLSRDLKERDLLQPEAIKAIGLRNKEPFMCPADGQGFVLGLETTFKTSEVPFLILLFENRPL